MLPGDTPSGRRTFPMHCKPALLVARLYRLEGAGPALRTRRTETQHCLQTGAVKAAAAHNTPAAARVVALGHAQYDQQQPGVPQPHLQLHQVPAGVFWQAVTGPGMLSRRMRAVNV